MSTEEIQLVLTALGPLSLVTSIILFRMFRNMLKSTVFGWASEFKNELFDEITQHPELFMPFVQSFLKKFGSTSPGGKQFKIFGFPVPQAVTDQIFGMIANKGMKMLEGEGTGAQQANNW